MREIARSAPARLIEEFYKLLRSGASEQAFRMMAERRLLEPIAHELQTGAGRRSVAVAGALDAYRQAIRGHPRHVDQRHPAGLAARAARHVAASPAPAPARHDELKKEPRLALGMLPLARRDVERLRQILALQRRLIDVRLSPRARRALMHRGPFREALTWLEIHGRAPEAVEHWRGFIEAAGAYEGEPSTERRPARRRRGAAATLDAAVVETTHRASSLGDAGGSPCVRSNSRMKSTSASTPSSGNAL